MLLQQLVLVDLVVLHQVDDRTIYRTEYMRRRDQRSVIYDDACMIRIEVDRD